MTTVDRPRELWNTMPGWGIVANLTPPEILAERQLKTVRKALAAALALIVVLGIGCYVLAVMGHRSATSALATEQDRTSQLVMQQHKYQRGVQVQNSITQVHTQLGTLLASDVDQAALAGEIRAKLPAGMTINQLTVTIDTGTTANVAGAGGAGSLDTSGVTHIGSVALSGNGRHLGDVSSFVNALATVAGVVAPYPASTTLNNSVVNWSIQLTLTSKLLTHRYDTTKNGAK